jgi:hypothetical protein
MVSRNRDTNQNNITEYDVEIAPWFCELQLQLDLISWNHGIRFQCGGEWWSSRHDHFNRTISRQARQNLSVLQQLSRAGTSRLLNH